MTRKKESEPALIIFVRNPILGQVKSRIAATVGPNQALSIYLQLLKHTHEVALGVDARRYIYYATFVDYDDYWSVPNFEKHLQSEGDLGDRMNRAIHDTLMRHDKVILIGSDCAELQPEVIKDGYDALCAQDIVLGPSRDGGYYLIGMKEAHRRLFDNMKWSRADVYVKTVERIRLLGLSMKSLPVLSDIDYIEDWEKYGWS